MSNKSTGREISFASLPKMSKTESAKLSVYLLKEELDILDDVRNKMGGVILPGLSDVIRYVVRDYAEKSTALDAVEKYVAEFSPPGTDVEDAVKLVAEEYRQLKYESFAKEGTTTKSRKKVPSLS